MTSDSPDAVIDDYSDRSSTFGDRIVAARDALGMTQAQLSRRLGVRPQTLQGWEDDRAEPRANKLQMLAGILNVSIIWLMTGEGQGPEHLSAEAPRDSAALLAELRTLRSEQLNLAARLGRLEKQLRGVLS